MKLTMSLILQKKSSRDMKYKDFFDPVDGAPEQRDPDEENEPESNDDDEDMNEEDFDMEE